MNGNRPRDTQVHSGQPAARPSVSGASSVTSERASRSVPGTSTGAGRSERLSGTERTARTSPTTATGTFTRNTDRQPALSPRTEDSGAAETRTPPRICPATMESPAVAPYRLMARALRGPAVDAWMVASTCGSMSAAAAPWATRAPTRVQASGASPQAREVRPKAAMPTRKSLRRPAMSPRRPPRTSSTAYARP
ncbi:hypothetical protein OKW18_004662 [Streptomyces pratensis]|nr:hypothetical protein [Streptomyces pratensis]